MKSIEKTALVAGGVIATYHAAKMIVKKLNGSEADYQPEPTLTVDDISSEVYYAASIGDSTKSGIGRRILPEEVSYEEWRGAGSPVRDEPYDVHATSIITNMGGPNQREFWAISDMSGIDDPYERVFGLPEDRQFELPAVPFRFSGPSNERYIALAHGIEQQLGRTGLTILVG